MNEHEPCIIAGVFSSGERRCSRDPSSSEGEVRLHILHRFAGSWAEDQRGVQQIFNPCYLGARGKMVKYAISIVYFVIPKCLKSCSWKKSQNGNRSFQTNIFGVIISFVIKALWFKNFVRNLVNLETHISLRCAWADQFCE